MKSKSLWTNATLLIVSVTCGFLIAEAVARVFIEPPRGHAIANKEQTEAHSSLLKIISDPKLLHRVAPNSPGHDVRGFRNAASPEAADVVAIGDLPGEVSRDDQPLPYPRSRRSSAINSSLNFSLSARCCSMPRCPTYGKPS